MQILQTLPHTRVGRGFWDLEPTLRTSRHSPTDPSLATRSIQKTGGLFNAGQSFDVGMCESALETFPVGGQKDEPLYDVTDFLFSSATDELFPSDGYRLDDVIDFGEPATADTIDFETFTSLAQFVNSDLLAELNTRNECSIEKESGAETYKTATKRSASAAFPIAPTSPIPTSDHNYHVLEDNRRQRFVSSSVANDDDESICSVDAVEMANMSSTKRAKYLERRKKNNIASKRSRETRKNKFVDMELQAEELERSNAELRNRILELERLTKQMKAILVEKLATSAK